MATDWPGIITIFQENRKMKLLKRYNNFVITQKHEGGEKDRIEAFIGSLGPHQSDVCGIQITASDLSEKEEVVLLFSVDTTKKLIKKLTKLVEEAKKLLTTKTE